jgi:hypothetical protein
MESARDGVAGRATGKRRRRLAKNRGPYRGVYANNRIAVINRDPN